MKKRDRKKIEASYDVASITKNNQEFWQYADNLSAVDANTESVRCKLRERSRYEYANNSYCQSVVNTVANDTIGKGGVRINFLADTPDHERLALDYRKWQKEVNYDKKVRSMRRAYIVDGECWLLPVIKKTLNNPVKLYMQLFETEQVGSFRETTKQKDGVFVDSFGEASGFNLYDEHPSNAMTSKGRKVDSKDIVQYANMTRIGQLRGIPVITPALPLFVQLRAYTLSVLDASETVARLSAVLETNAPAGTTDEPDDVEEGYELSIGRNTIKTLPYMWKLSQLKAEQPTNTYADFKKQILSEIGSCLGVPYHVVALDSSSHNFASARMDRHNYMVGIGTARTEMNNTIHDPMFERYATEWKAVNHKPNLDTSHTWVYDGLGEIDPSKTATATTKNLENMTTNLAIECASDGNNWKNVIDQRLIEEKYVSEQRTLLGLDEDENEELK